MSGLFRSLASRGRALLHRLEKKQRVGSDLHGNDYYLHYENPQAPPKRICEFKDSTTMIDSNDTIPTQWLAWLRGHRAEPPTISELHDEVRRQSEMKAHVAALEAADAKLRLQEIAERRLSGQSLHSSDQSAQSMMQQLEDELEQEKRLQRRASLQR